MYLWEWLVSKSTADTSVIVCDEIINDTDSVWTNVTNTILRNVTNTMSIISDEDKMDCYVLDTVFLVIILLFIVAIICYHHTKHKSKQKHTGTLTI